jgi:glutamate synthase (NADPH/NADH) small chain
MVEPNRVGGFPFRKADAEERKTNFSEVQHPYSTEEAMREAERCLLCGTPVCIDACPVLLDVRGMNEAVARGDFKTAYERIRETNPLLGVTARCCPQLQGLCEDACVLKWSGQPIGIGLIQRYVADWEKKNRQKQKQQQELPAPVSIAQDTGKKVAVIGAGPAGLAAAALLRRYGHKVTIYEALHMPGGTAWYSVPDYHLPKDVLLYEVDRIRDMGVEIRTDTTVGKDVTLPQLLDENDAVLITTGSKDARKLDTPGSDLKGVLSGYDFLESVYGQGVDNYLKNPKYELGTEIVVIGGGDTSLDCARTALRLTRGKGSVTILCRQPETGLHVDPVMLAEAKEEGVEFKFLVQAKSFEGDSNSGRVVAAVIDNLRMGEPDSKTGKQELEPIPGKEFRMPCSTVLVAIGRGPNSFLQKKAGIRTGKRNAIAIGDDYRTSMDRVFAAGDVTTGETLIVKAMEKGREGAQRVHEYLMDMGEANHVSFYERYYKERSYEKMVEGKEDKGLPPD